MYVHGCACTLTWAKQASRPADASTATLPRGEPGHEATVYAAVLSALCMCRLGELKLMAGRIMEMRQALRDGLEKEGQWATISM